MRLLIQRCSQASVTIDDADKRSIDQGLVVLLGIEEADSSEDIQWLCKKLLQMRIFPDQKGVMNRSVLDTQGDILLVSQFTLHASVKKGNRPSYIRAAKPDTAIPLYKEFIGTLQSSIGDRLQTGEFGADMQVALVNDGPVTIWVDSKQKE